MDIVTQGVLGATMAVAVSPLLLPSRQRLLSAGVGLVAGLLPDADALIQSGGDPLLVLDYHRHFTHALAFVPLGALIAALLLWPWLRRRLSFARLYGLCFAGYALAPVLDACTSYGTHLWLPFSARKEAWNLIAVVDPVFTLLLAVPLYLSLRRTGSRAVYVGLLLALAYLGLGYGQQQRVEGLMREVAAARGHRPAQLSVKPTLGNLVLWRSLYVQDGRMQADAVHAGLALRHYPGQSAPLMTRADPARTADVARFRAFADGLLVETRPGFVGDGRYAMLPTDIAPIWGLEWGADGRVDFVTRREMTPEMRARWVAMLLGRV